PLIMRAAVAKAGSCFRCVTVRSALPRISALSAAWAGAAKITRATADAAASLGSNVFMEGHPSNGMSIKTGEGEKSSQRSSGRRWRMALSGQNDLGLRNCRPLCANAFGKAAGEILEDDAELLGID